MNQKKARQLRKQVFGNLNTKIRQYVKDPKSGMILNAGLHGVYKKLKANYKGNPKAKEIFARRGD